MEAKRILPKDRDTYIFIDVSNIRWACERSCDFNLDFVKLYEYFNGKYNNLREVRYYEGIASGDKSKRRHFRFLEKVGYRVCPLLRKSYVDRAKYENFKCVKCGAINTVEILPETVKLKSNVDVYLATDMLECAVKNKKAIHIILVSCDGDYAEAIKAVMRLNPKVFVTVLATPATRKGNCLSVRLKVLRRDYPSSVDIANIATIKERVSQPFIDRSKHY